MTTMVKTKSTEYLVYIASDGKEFTNANDCRAYEDEMRAKSNWESLIVTTIHTPNVYNVYDADIYLLEIKNDADYETVLNYPCKYNFTDSYASENLPKIKDKHSYPFKVIYFENDSFADVYDKDDFVKEMTSALQEALK